MALPIAAITTTPAGVRVLAPLCYGTADLWLPAGLAAKLEAQNLGSAPHSCYDKSLANFLQAYWHQYEGFVFCLASGAVVRLIAPLLESKHRDPAVVVLDAKGQFALSLCSGHQGGGDRLARTVAQLIGAQPVLTGSANGLDLPGIDTLGNPFGWEKGSGDWTGVSAAIAQSLPASSTGPTGNPITGPVEVIQEAGTTLWQQNLPAHHPFQFGFSDFSAQRPQPIARLWISPIKRRFAPPDAQSTAYMPKAQWHPRVLWVGLGCERGSEAALIEQAIESVCQRYQLASEAIAGIATLALKSDEVGLLDVIQKRGWPLQCYEAEQLKALAEQLPLPNPSAVVAKAVGTPSVAEAAAMLAAAQASSSAPDLSNLRVSKQIVKRPDQSGAVTVAIAQATREYTARAGQLLLIGTGPGSLEQITPAARAAITEAEVVIGYTLYVDLIQALLHPAQIIEALPITQERERAERAIELARWGLKVAVISSGDCGIYGMAGLVLEQLQTQGWDGKTPAVKVLPGVSALQSAAARVGAPLMHDFCAISLSDLLTPWPVIQQRLRAAAAADFVVALYNPKSKTRTEQILFAHQILLSHRSASTPVALARSLHRPDEHIVLTTLGEMLQHPIDMLTTVIIGNRSSRVHAGWFITPRGYLGNLEGEKVLPQPPKDESA